MEEELSSPLSGGISFELSKPTGGPMMQAESGRREETPSNTESGRISILSGGISGSMSMMSRMRAASSLVKEDECGNSGPDT